jgi:hypothetical protein
MADNVTLPGTGEVVATDDIGGVLYQRVKLIHGADGVTDGDVSRSNPLPVAAQALSVLRRIAALLKPLQQITGGGSNRLSVDVNAVTAVSTVTTVSAVSTVAASTLTNVANVWAFDQAKATSRQAYNSGIRARL